MSDHSGVTPASMRAWGRHARDSPLYHHLSEVVAEREELLEVVNRIENRPRPNLLFAAVHYLLADGADHELAGYYPSLTPDPRPMAQAGPVFARFVLEHAGEIVRIGRERYTQTNECRRCVALLPAVMSAPFDRFHLVELGASAGLNLALDRYRYRWGGLEWGPASPVTLETELRGEPPRLRGIEVLSRIGLDLEPMDPGDPDHRRWLEALVWPEHHQRRTRLRAALGLVAELAPEMVRGDAAVTLPDVLARLPNGDPAVLMSPFTLVQLSPGQLERIAGTVAEERHRRPLLRVSMEASASGGRWAALDVDDGSGLVAIGRAHAHGEWLQLYARP